MYSSAQMPSTHPRSVDLYNEGTVDSTVGTDGKNREAARLAGSGLISPDEVTTSNATLDNAMPEAGDGLAGFDSRSGGNHLALALRAGYVMIEKGFDTQLCADDEQFGPVHRMHGNAYWPGHARRPERVIELTTTPR